MRQFKSTFESNRQKTVVDSYKDLDPTYVKSLSDYYQKKIDKDIEEVSSRKDSDYEHNSHMVNYWRDLAYGSKNTDRTSTIGDIGLLDAENNDLNELSTDVEFKTLADKILYKKPISDAEVFRFEELRKVKNPDEVNYRIKRYSDFLGIPKEKEDIVITDPTMGLYNYNLKPESKPKPFEFTLTNQGASVIANRQKEIEQAKLEKQEDLKVFDQELAEMPKPDKWYEAKKREAKEKGLSWDYMKYGTAELIGSSNQNPYLAAGQAAAMVAGIGLGAAISGGTIGALAAWTIGAGIAGSGLYMAAKGRSLESAANSADNRMGRVMEDLKKNGIDINDPSFIMNLKGYDNEGKEVSLYNPELPDNSPETILQKALTVNTNNEVLEQLKKKSFSGLLSEYEKENKLSVGDFVEQGLNVIPIGKVVKAAVLGKTLGKLTEESGKIGKFAKLYNDADNTAALSIEMGQKYSKLNKVQRLAYSAIDNAATFNKRVVTGSFEGMSKTGAFGAKVLKKSLPYQEFVGKTIMTGEMEGAEETAQMLLARDYKAGKFDNKYDDVLTDINDAYGAQFYSVGYDLGVIKDATLDNDKEYFENRLGGRVLGGLMSGVFGGISAGVQYGQSRMIEKPVNDIIRSYTADQILEKDVFIKAQMYAKKGIDNKQQVVHEAFEKLKLNMPEGLTAEDIDAEKARAINIMKIANDKGVKKVLSQLAIPEGSQDHATLVALIDKSNRDLNSVKLEESSASMLSMINRTKSINSITSKLQDFNEATDKNLDINDLTSLYDATVKMNASEQVYNRFAKLEGKTEEADKGIKNAEKDLNNNKSTHSELLQNLVSKYNANDLEIIKDIVDNAMDEETSINHITATEALQHILNRKSELVLKNNIYKGYQLQEKVNGRLVKKSLKLSKDDTNGKFILAEINKLKETAEINKQNAKPIVEEQKAKDKLAEETGVRTNVATEQESQEQQPIQQQQVSVKPILKPSTPLSTENGQVVPEVQESVANVPQNASNEDINEISAEDLSKLQEINESFDINELPEDFMYSEEGDVETSENASGWSMFDALKDDSEALNDKEEESDTKESTLSDKVDDTNKEIDSLWSEFNSAVTDFNKNKHVLGFANNSQELQAKVIALGIRLIGAYTKLGIYKISDIVKNAIDKNIDITAEVLEGLKMAYMANYALLSNDDLVKFDDTNTVRSFKIEDLNKEPETIEEQTKESSNSNNTQVVKKSISYDELDPLSHTFYYEENVSPMTIPTLVDSNNKPIKLESGKELAKVIANKDFAEKADIYFHIGEFKNSKVVYAIIKYNGKTYASALKGEKKLNELILNSYPDLSLTEIEIINKKSRIFKENIINLQAKNPNSRIVPTTLKIVSTDYKNNVKEGSVEVIQRNLSDIKGLGLGDNYKDYRSKNIVFGYGTGEKGATVIYTEVGSVKTVMPGHGDAGVIYLYPDTSIFPDGISRNISLNKKKFSTLDTDQKVGILSLFRTLLKHRSIHKETVGKALIDREKLFNFIFNVGARTKYSELSNKKIYTYTNKETKEVFITYGESGETISVTDYLNGNGNFRDLDNFIIDNLSTHISESFNENTVMFGNIGELFIDIKQYLQENYKSTKETKYSIIPGMLEFDLEDLGLIESNGRLIIDKDNEYGLQTTTWYVKHGWLTSPLHDDIFKNRYMSVQDVQVETPLVKSVKADEKKDKSKQTTNTTSNINEEYKGKIIYATPGSGKSFISNNKDIIDVDIVLANKISELGFDRNENESDRSYIIRYVRNNPDWKILYDVVKTELISLKDSGKTILTGSQYFFDVADIILSQQDKSLIRAGFDQRVENKVKTRLTPFTGYLSDFISKSIESTTNVQKSSESTVNDELERLLAEQAEYEKQLKKYGGFSTIPAEGIYFDAASEVQFLKDKLGLKDSDIQIVENMTSILGVNGIGVFGLMTDDAIVLSERSVIGTAYHEAFHRVSLLLLSPEERKSIYKDYRKSNSISDTVSDKEVEEMLAEDYRKAILTNGIDIRFYSIKQLFRKIIRYTKSILGINNYTKDRLFKDISLGVFNSSKINQESLDAFKTNYEIGAKLKIDDKVISNKDYNKIIRSLSFELLALSNVKIAKDISNINFNILKESLSRKVRIAELRNDPNKDMLQLLYNNFDNIVADDISTLLKNISINIKDTNINDEVEAKENGEIGMLGDKNPAEVDPIHAIYTEVKLAIATLAETTTKNGVTEMVINPYTGGYEIIDFNLAWNKLITEVHDVESAEALMDRLLRVNKSTGDDFFRMVHDKLENYAKQDQNFLTQVYVSLKKHRNKFIQAETSISKNTKWDEGQGKFITSVNTKHTKTNPNTSTAENKLISSWQNIFTDKFINPVTGEINIELMNSIVTDFGKIDGVVKAYIKDKRVATDLDIEKIINNIHIIFQRLGLEEVTKDILKNISGKDGIVTIHGINNLLTKIVVDGRHYTGLRTFISNHLNDILKTSTIDKLGYTTTVGKNQQNISIQELINKTNFARLYSKQVIASNPLYTSSTPGPNGTSMFNMQQNNTITDIVNRFNKDQSFRKQLKKVTFVSGFSGYGSLLLTQLGEGGRIEVETHLQTIETGKGNKGKDYFDISDAEDYITKMTYCHNDILVSPTMADKKSHYELSGKNIKLFHNTLEIENGNLVISEDVLKQYRYYIETELDTIEESYLNYLIYTKDGKDELLVDNYNKSTKKGGFNAFKFRNFDLTFVDDNGRIWTFNELFKNKDKTQEAVNYLRNIFENKDKFNAIISNNINYAVQQELFTMRKLKIVDFKTDEKTGNIIPKSLISKKLDSERVTDGINKFKDFGMLRNYASILQIATDFTIDYNVSQLEFQKLISKDPAFYKDHDDYIKRLGGFNSTGDNGRFDFNVYMQDGSKHPLFGHDGKYNVVELEEVVTSLPNDEMNSLKEKMRKNILRDFKELYNGKTEEEINNLVDSEVEKQMNPYKSIDWADAEVLISPEMYRNILMMWGEWTPEVSEAFSILEQNNNWLTDIELSAKAMGVILKPLKYVYMGNEFRTDNTDIPIYNKMALFPVFKAISSTGYMKEIYDRMSDKNSPIHMFKMQSATKTGGKSKFKFYNRDGSTNRLSTLPSNIIYKEDYKWLRKQLVTDPHDVERTLTGTQVIKAALSNIKHNISYNLSMNGKDEVNGLEIATEVMTCLKTLSENGKSRFFKKYGVSENEDGLSINEEKLGKHLHDKAKSNNLSKQVLNTFKTIDGKFVKSLKGLPVVKWIEQEFIAMVNKDTVDVNLPGNSFIQMSSAFFETIGGDTKINGVTDEGFTLNNGEKLKFDTEGNYIEAVISMNLFEPMFPKNIKGENGTYGQKKAWLISKNIIGKDASPMAMGYRIPTQGQSSIDVLKIVDVLPSTIGDTVMLPAAFTKKNGSDFDVDKLFIARYNYDKNGEKYKILDDTNSTVEDRFKTWAKVNTRDSEKEIKTLHKKWLLSQNFESNLDIIGYNVKLQSELENLKNQFELDNFKNFKSKSIHDQNIREAVENRLLDCYVTLLTSDNHIHETKASIDTVTSDLKDNVLGTIEKLIGKKDSKYGLNTISPTYHLNKKLENVVSKNGIGPFALNLVHHALTQIYEVKITNSTLLSLGMSSIDGIYGKDGIRILDWLSAMINAHVDAAKDPYITRLNVVPYTYNVTALMLRSGIGGNTFFFLKQPIISYMLDLINSQPNIGKDQIATELSKVFGGKPSDYDSDLVSNKVLDNKDYLMKQLSDKSNSDEWKKGQIEIYNIFKEIHKAAYDLSEFVGVSKIDTKGFGNTGSALRIFEKRYNKFLSNNSTFSNVNKFFKDSFMETKLNNSVILIQNLFKDYLISYDPKYVKNETILLSSIGREFTGNQQIIDDVSNALLASYRSSFFNNFINNKYESYVKKMLLDIPVIENESISTRLFTIKRDIFAGKYPDLIDNGIITNTLLAAITGYPKQYNDNSFTPNLIRVLKGSNNQLDFTDQMIQGWEELFDSSNETLRNFAQDLAIFAFYSTAGKSAVHSLFQYIPESFLEYCGYDQFGKNISDEVNFDDIFKNNWYNNNLVPEVNDFDLERQSIEKLNIFGYDDAKGKKMQIEAPTAFIVKANKYKQSTIKPYVKKTISKDGERIVLLYKRVATIGSFMKEQSVYALCEKKGFKQSDRMFTEYTGTTASTWFTNKLERVSGGQIKNAFYADNMDVFDSETEFERLFKGKIKGNNFMLVSYSELYQISNDQFIEDYTKDLEEVDIMDDTEGTNNEEMIDETIDTTTTEESKTYTVEDTTTQSEQSEITEREYTPENITSLKPNEVFVFGSNTEGRHGKGAALTAKNNFGAKYGNPSGMQGKSYAIITKNLTKNVEYDGQIFDKTGEKSVSLDYIGEQIADFVEFAQNNPDKKFYVTKLGSSLAGYSTEEIKSQFEEVSKLNGFSDNIILPIEYEFRDTKVENTAISQETLNEINEKHNTSYTMEQFNALSKEEKEIAINCK